VAYRLKFHENNVAPYIFNLDLSREGRVTLLSFLYSMLCENADRFRNDPEDRLAPDSNYFGVDLIFRDSTRKKIHDLRLIINDAAAQYGILRVDYAEGVYTGSVALVFVKSQANTLARMTAGECSRCPQGEVDAGTASAL